MHHPARRFEAPTTRWLESTTSVSASLQSVSEFVGHVHGAAAASAAAASSSTTAEARARWFVVRLFLSRFRSAVRAENLAGSCGTLDPGGPTFFN